MAILSLLGLKLKQDHIHYHARQPTIDQQEWIRDQAFDKKSKEEEELNWLWLIWIHLSK